MKFYLTVPHVDADQILHKEGSYLVVADDDPVFIPSATMEPCDEKAKAALERAAGEKAERRKVLEDQAKKPRKVELHVHPKAAEEEEPDERMTIGEATAGKKKAKAGPRAERLGGKVS